MIHWLAEPWQYGFFRHGMIAAILAGALAGLIGIYVILRRMSYIGHGLSHAILGGAGLRLRVGLQVLADGRLKPTSGAHRCALAPAPHRVHGHRDCVRLAHAAFGHEVVPNRLDEHG